MTDSDIILYLYPSDGPGYRNAENVISMPQNEPRYMPPNRRVTPEPGDSLSRQDRESTEQPEEQRGLESTACLALRFSHGAKTRLGVVVGCGRNVDLPLRKLPGISRFHLAFTFDDKNRPIVRDLGSLCGTKVIYDVEEGERRSNFDFLLQGPGILNNKPPVVNVTSHTQFKIVVPPHDIMAQDYIDRVNRFRQGAADPEYLFASLALQSAPGTQPSTGKHTPSRLSGPVLYKKKLGEGVFGIVTYIWNATTGEEYAMKEPLVKVIRSGQVIIKDWKKEAQVMENISHDHIVAFRDARFFPCPQLTFEYIPGGSLDGHVNLSTFENVQILRQLLSALQYLHGKTPPIGHRDIKPENILVLYRRFSGIRVKFADFGLAKAADYLKTFCGTLKWAAPEIYNKVPDPEATVNDKYSVAVDIWSLGLVIASQECGLPYYKQSYRNSAVAWIRVVLQHVEDFEEKGNSLLYFLLDTMLVMSPYERKGAPYCHHEALRLSNCDSRLPFLHRISRDSLTPPRNDESDRKCDSGTSTPSVPINRASEEPTLRPSPQDEQLQISAKPTAASINSSTKPPKAQMHQKQDSSVFIEQRSVLNSMLWNSEPADCSSNYNVIATETSSPENDAQPKKLKASLVDEVQEIAVSPETATRKPRYKRSWTEDCTSMEEAQESSQDLSSRMVAPQCDDILDQDASLGRVLRSGKRRKNIAISKDPKSK